MTAALTAASAEFEALCNQIAATMDSIRPAIETLARSNGASEIQLGWSMGKFREELCDLVADRQSAIEDRISDAERAAEEADAAC